ncbi:MAG: hypothetical protein IKJ01_02795, partial [Lachnospiraceae bacterium]|nr:hypothetical protein [Lachnospiraceae bacterium]
MKRCANCQQVYTNDVMNCPECNILLQERESNTRRNRRRRISAEYKNVEITNTTQEQNVHPR